MKGLKKYMAGILVAGMVLGSAAVPAPVYATEAEDAQEDNGDDVEITLDDKPYLALGADLTADQQHTVLSYMGIEAADFDKYDVVYVSKTYCIYFDLFSFHVGSDWSACNFQLCADGRKRCNDKDAAYRAEKGRRNQFHNSED